jgi:hypothetical protein
MINFSQDITARTQSFTRQEFITIRYYNIEDKLEC